MMRPKYICDSLECVIYVYGDSTNGICPGCDMRGVPMDAQTHEFFSFMWDQSRARRGSRV